MNSTASQDRNPNSARKNQFKWIFYVFLAIVFVPLAFFTMTYFIKEYKLSSLGQPLFLVLVSFYLLDGLFTKKLLLAKWIGMLFCLVMVIYYSYLWPFALVAKRTPEHFDVAFASFSYGELFFKYQWLILLKAIGLMIYAGWMAKVMLKDRSANTPDLVSH